MNRSGRSNRGTRTQIHSQIEQCIRACNDRTGLKIVVAPSSHAARMLRTALARQECPLVNVEALTPTELARHIVRTMAPDDRRRTVSHAEGAFIVGQLTSDVDSEAADLLGRAAFPVWSAIQELRASGVSASDVARAAGRPHERVLARLHEAYDGHLHRLHLRDAADIMLRAIELADEFARRRAPELLAVLDQVQLGDQEARLIELLSGASKRAVLIGHGISQWPEDRAASVLSDWDRAGDVTEEPQDAVRPQPVTTAGERREEVAAVLADIVDRGLSFDEVEIAWTSEDPYRQELRAACSRYGIPVSDAGSRPATSTPTGAAIAAALRWVAGGYSVEELVSMLRLGYLRPPQGDAVRIAAVLDRFPVSLAQAARPAVRDRLFERARQEHVDPGSMADTFRMMDSLRGILPPGKGAAGKGLVSFVESFLRDHVRAKSPGAHRAPDDVSTLLLAELAFLGGVPEDASAGVPDELSTAASFAVQVVERFSVRSEPEAGGLTIVPLEDAGFGRASHVYVVGLDDQSCSDRSPEDSLLTDAFRNRLIDPAGRGPRPEKPVSVGVLVASLEASRPGMVSRYRALYDVAQNRPLFPVAEDLHSGHAPTAEVSSETSADAPSDAPVPPVLDLTDRFLSEPAVTSIEFAGALFDNIEQGRLAAQARDSLSWTAYDGMVTAANDLLPDALSPSALETLAECPYRYFLQYILRVPVHESRDPDEWMTASDRGQILHTLFERHARRRMNGGVIEDDTAWLSVEVRDLLDRFAAANPPPHDAFMEEARREIEAAGRVYLHTEREQEGRAPHAAEFRFGSDEHADAPPLELTISEDATISLTGRVDRIDLTTDGRLIVTDFKTGKRRGLRESDLRKLDTKLQWAIYARLARAHFERTVESSGYLFVSTHELGLRREAAPPPDEELDRILGEMLGRVRAGFFARNANPNGDPCSYCDFKSVCGDLGARRDEMRAKACASVETEDDLAPLIETWNGFSRRVCS